MFIIARSLVVFLVELGMSSGLWSDINRAVFAKNLQIAPSRLSLRCWRMLDTHPCLPGFRRRGPYRANLRVRVCETRLSHFSGNRRWRGINFQGLARGLLYWNICVVSFRPSNSTPDMPTIDHSGLWNHQDVKTTIHAYIRLVIRTSP